MYKHPLVRTTFGEDNNLLYAPTLDRVWIVPKDKDPGSDEIEDGKPLIESSKKLHITLVPTYSCNLRCIYCYEGHQKGKELSLGTAQEITSRLIRQYGNPSEGMVLSYFGGEPTLSMDFMLSFTKWIRQTYPGYEIKIGMTTNGIIPKDRLKQVWNAVDKIMISMDGPEEIHNVNRPLVNGQPSFCRTWDTMRQLYQQKPDELVVRITVTDRSVGILPSICKFFHEQVPGVPQIYVPVMSSAFADSTFTAVDMNAFAEGYLKTYAIAREHGASIKTSMVSFSKTSDLGSFCGVTSKKFTILPDGSLATCHRVHSTTVRSGPFFLAETGQDVFSRKPYHLPIACEHCFARYNCKGGCYASRHSFKINEDEKLPFCDAIRRMVLGVITKKQKGGEIK